MNMTARFSYRRSRWLAAYWVLILSLIVLGISQVAQANLLEELEASQSLQSPSAGNPPVPSGSPPPPEPAQLNSADGLKPSSDVASPSSSPAQPSSGMMGCNSNGPMLNLAPGSYIQFKVAVPPGFLARLDDTPDGGKVITVISPEPPCPKCGLTARSMEGQGSATNSFDNPPLPPPPPPPPSKMVIQNYQEQMMQRPVPQPSANYPQEYQRPDQAMSSQMYVKNGYRKMPVGGPNQMQYQARATQNFPPPPPPPPQPSYARIQSPLPQPQPTMTQRMVRPPPVGYEAMPSAQYQQQQYTQMNSAPEYQPPPQRQQQSATQYIQQSSDGFQSQYPPSPQPGLDLQKFHTAVRSLDEGNPDQQQ